MTLHEVRAIVLAGGRGERLRPLTETCPKPLLPLNGKRLIDYSLDAIRASGVRALTIGVGYRAEEVEAHVGPSARFIRDGIEMSDKVLLAAKDASEPTLLGFSADTLVTRQSVELVVSLHNRQRYDATLLLTTLPEPQQKRWSFRISNDMLEEIAIEKTFTKNERVGVAFSRQALSDLTQGFSKCLSHEIASDKSPVTDGSQAGWYFLLGLMLEKGMRIQAVVTDHPIYNINTVDSLLAAPAFVAAQFAL